MRCRLSTEWDEHDQSDTTFRTFIVKDAVMMMGMISDYNSAASASSSCFVHVADRNIASGHAVLNSQDTGLKGIKFRI